ncbi:LysR family transcriptional regulator [Pseudomonas putida]|uniref:LysR family transcriptional regulator n=1 Tax=Pseudomonas putida TaxID=303 RepID=UPI001F5163B9|nr:LysR family transcriptional regulator [Pseudomonas putida]MCI1024904.1 LysR family transcriptional regulator [Pseudomonas putida]
MRYSPEALVAFVEAAAQGSFSAAARKLNKSQSTISIAISNLEADIGCALFDRSGRHPVLTDAGHQVRRHIEAILAESSKLDALAVRLVGKVESTLAVVTTDLTSVVFQGDIMSRFAEKFPDTELRYGPSEDADVLNLIQEGMVDVGLLAAQPAYPADITMIRLAERAEFGLYASKNHPLASAKQLNLEDLESVRRLYLKTYAPSIREGNGQAWSAPDYLTLMEFAVTGFGWAELPQNLVSRFGRDLVELKVPGYPRGVNIDVAWSRDRPLGPAGQWLVDQLRNKRG